ncbi:MAG: CDP-glycerol glycerophosphotransferase family protein [Candidatus Paceibacterota bacterium]|jgi:hypothetical protein
MKNRNEVIFIAYESGHLEEAEKKSKDGTTVICLDFLLERECKKRNISFIPLRNFVDSETGEEEWWKLSHDIAREWYRVPGMAFFQHRDIRIAEAPEPIMQAHLAKLFYYVRIFLFLKKSNPGSSFCIPNPIINNVSTTECLSVFQPWAVVDAARMVGLMKDDRQERIIPKTYIFTPATRKSRLLKIYNFLIGLSPRHKTKVYMSGYWTHAESLVPLMDDTEIILLESKLFTMIPWKQLIKHRMRAMYSHGAINHTEERIAKQVGQEFMGQWKSAKEHVRNYLYGVRENLDWSPVIEACEHLMLYAPRVVADINTLFKIMKKEKPNIVLQMASVGGPHHYFFLMAHVAKQLGIPSIEMQHATVTIDPRSVYCRIETDYLLTFGDIISSWHRRIGNTSRQLISVGSPRFDKYVNERMRGIERGKQLLKNLGLDIERPILLVIIPFSETYASAIDSYQLAEFIEMISLMHKENPGLQILFKCRTPKLIDHTKEYLKEYFSSDWTVSGEEDIFPLLCASDAVMCNNSTVIYQAVLAKKPLVLHPWKRFDSYHARIYSSFIPLAYSSREVREIIKKVFTDNLYYQELLSKQEKFLHEYSFDGKSSERVAKLIKELAHR